MSAGVPIACILSGSELREREKTVLAAFDTHVSKVEARPDGYMIEVAAIDETIAAAMALIQVERRCCPFLRFDLTVEPEGGLVQLALTGPPGVLEFLARWLEPRTARDKSTS